MFTIGNAKCIECINQTRERHFVATDEKNVFLECSGRLRRSKKILGAVASRIFLAFMKFAIFSDFAISANSGNYFLEAL